MNARARRPLVLVAVLAVALSAAVTAWSSMLERPAPRDPDAGAGFARLRALAGTWSFTSHGGQGRVSYELVSDGSAILERVTNDEHGEAGMVSVIHLDGDRLVLQHYCSAGNQPRLVSPGLDGNEIRFTFDGITNLATPSAGHIHGAVFRFPQDRPFESTWTWREDGVDTPDTRRHLR